MADSVIITSNVPQARDELEQKTLKALEMIGLVAEGYAKLICPVDTGRLRNSITHKVDIGEQAAYIGTNVEYAPYVELGTSRQKAQPYLKPAAENHAQEYRDIFDAVLKS